MRRLWLVVLCAPLQAFALQPLEEFIQSARGFNPDAKEALATKMQRDAQATAALGQVLPSLQARLAYTRNQYNVVFDLPGSGPSSPTTQITVSPYNQIDGYAQLNVPLVNLAGFFNAAAAKTGAHAASEQLQAVRLQVESQVVQDYYQLVANQALVSASQKTLEVAKANLQLTDQQLQAGRAAALDMDRAKAEVERSRQQLTQAELSVSLAARGLESSSGVAPDLQKESPLVDDLHEEPPLDTFQRKPEELPAVASAMEARRSADQAATAQKLALAPSLAGNALEHGTNAASLVGREFVYDAMVTLAWQVDLTTIANIYAQAAAADAAKAREQRVELNVRDAIHRTWATVGSDIVRSRSARAEQQAASHASRLAQARYEAGSATQLDLLSAARDAFNADVSRIQADADLANARLQLKLAAGIDPFPSKGTP
jgi:outer membrane protein TolC